MTSTRSAADTGLPEDTTPIDDIDPAKIEDLYGLHVQGDSMAPDCPDGSYAICSRTEPPKKHDIVAVWFAPGFATMNGQPMRVLIRRLAMALPDIITFPHRPHPESEVRFVACLSTNDEPDTMMPVPCEHVQAVHRCIGVQRNIPTGERDR